MKTIEEIRKLSGLADRRTVYYRIKISGIEEKEGYIPEYIYGDGQPVRVFHENEAELLIDIKKIKKSSKNV